VLQQPPGHSLKDDVRDGRPKLFHLVPLEKATADLLVKGFHIGLESLLSKCFPLYEHEHSLLDGD
jgi:hypothetical protein